MFPYRTIVVATDFSECAQRALREAVVLAEASAGRLHLLHVSTLSSGPPGSEYVRDEATGGMRTMSSWLVERNEQLLQHAVRALGPAAVPIDVHVRIGDVVRATVAFVDEVRADLLVVGTHGRTGWRHMVLGAPPSASSRCRPSRCSRRSLACHAAMSRRSSRCRTTARRSRRRGSDPRRRPDAARVAVSAPRRRGRPGDAGSRGAPSGSSVGRRAWRGAAWRPRTARRGPSGRGRAPPHRRCTRP